MLNDELDHVTLFIVSSVLSCVCRGSPNAPRIFRSWCNISSRNTLKRVENRCRDSGDALRWCYCNTTGLEMSENCKIFPGVAIAATFATIDINDLPEQVQRTRRHSASIDKSWSPLPLDEIRSVHIQRMLDVQRQSCRHSPNARYRPNQFVSLLEARRQPEDCGR